MYPRCTFTEETHTPCIKETLARVRGTPRESPLLDSPKIQPLTLLLGCKEGWEEVELFLTNVAFRRRKLKERLRACQSRSDGPNPAS